MGIPLPCYSFPGPYKGHLRWTEITSASGHNRIAIGAEYRGGALGPSNFIQNTMNLVCPFREPSHFLSFCQSDAVGNRVNFRDLILRPRENSAHEASNSAGERTRHPSPWRRLHGRSQIGRIRERTRERTDWNPSRASCRESKDGADNSSRKHGRLGKYERMTTIGHPPIWDEMPKPCRHSTSPDLTNQ
jgi:hypothetical protein